MGFKHLMQFCLHPIAHPAFLIVGNQNRLVKSLKTHISQDGSDESQITQEGSDEKIDGKDSPEEVALACRNPDVTPNEGDESVPYVAGAFDRDGTQFDEKRDDQSDIDGTGQVGLQFSGDHGKTFREKVQIRRRRINTRVNRSTGPSPCPSWHRCGFGFLGQHRPDLHPFPQTSL